MESNPLSASGRPEPPALANAGRGVGGLGLGLGKSPHAETSKIPFDSRQPPKVQRSWLAGLGSVVAVAAMIGGAMLWAGGFDRGEMHEPNWAGAEIALIGFFGLIVCRAYAVVCRLPDRHW